MSVSRGEGTGCESRAGGHRGRKASAPLRAACARLSQMGQTGAPLPLGFPVGLLAVLERKQSDSGLEDVAQELGDRREHMFVE
jgi:hypothetical protein